MIDTLSQTLRAILQDPALAADFPELSAADIVFDRPTDPFAIKRTTVDLFLYDLREDLDLRSNEPIIERTNGQAIVHAPPLRLACSYLVTAWPLGGLDLALQEHRLLGQVLRVLSRYPTIPASFLQGDLVGQEPPLPMVALHPDALKNLSEFWTSVGNKLRASLTITVTIGVPVFADVTKSLVTTATSSVAQGQENPENWMQIGGNVKSNLGARVSGALVDLLDLGQRTTTDEDGHFVFSHVDVGVHTLRVVATGFQPFLNTVLQVPGRPGDYDVSLTPL
ncbi:MAG: Pvc16 family protein [Acidobacteriia bacterium]|nr:Pvc16 family protein [Terriglobia bacterium]